ncbi:hypothetical protein GH714_036922 [Hevea brasiliensis]|uniref:Crossover junction endonuclease MUS81 n=1 Tax=Hevea brasiliensis TaxID=3981 RepID=A0A6A6NF71_HEVBR|nr:hypothetical protein GH714_036922 [Hevea brasiliensis]
MQNQNRVFCPENEELVSFMLQKRQELAERPEGISENIDMILSKAYNSVCSSKTPIKTLKDLSQIKGVGKWILKLMQGFFDSGSGISEPEDLTKKVKRAKGTKRYVPQKNSVAYALLITLYRGTSNGNEFMRKQELIDAAEASGLSRVSILQEKGKGKPGQFGSSSRDWYSGWSCMKTLICKGLVVKSSCPAKYMLTEEGQEAARECLLRSRLLDPREGSANVEVSSDVDMDNASDLESAHPGSTSLVISSSVGLSRKKKSIDVPLESLERFMRMGYTKEQVLHAVTEVSETSHNKRFLLWPAVLCRLREDQVYGLHSEPQTLRKDCQAKSTAHTFTNVQVDLVGNQSVGMDLTSDDGNIPNLHSVCSAPDAFTLRTCSSSVRFCCEEAEFGWPGSKHEYFTHAASELGERFEDVYERCGLKKLIYLVEGDPNSCEAAESIKTACFTTEILEGFDVQRTSCLRDTLKKYGYLTHSITQYYGSQLPEYEPNCAGVCPPFDEFIKRCQDLDKMTVCDVFAIQLMQVPQVTEEIAIAVLDLYPTLVSLARAYSLLDGDVCAQEEMLRKQSNNAISATASRNIFRLVWGNDQ